jgi:hypothetical protein
MSLFKKLGLNLDIAKPELSYEEAKSLLEAALEALEKDKANISLLKDIWAFAQILAKIV